MMWKVLIETGWIGLDDGHYTISVLRPIFGYWQEITTFYFGKSNIG